MDPRTGPGPDIDPQGPPPSDRHAAVLPSRVGAAADCRRAIRRGLGPVLLTGAAGSGKSWLWTHLALEPARDLRWLGVDAAPDLDGYGLCRAILDGLGRFDSGSILEPRSALRSELAEQSAEGTRWVFVLDEAQNASDVALEEFRLLSNRLGASGGFRGMVLSGRTGLARRLGDRAWASLESRLSSHVRLGPIDAEDAAFLLRLPSGDTPSTAEVERLHARSGGNPARLIRLADLDNDRSPIAASPSRSSRRVPIDEATAIDAEAPVARPAVMPAVARPAVMPAVERPPLRFEDGMIEVGWDDQGEDDPLDDESADEPIAGSMLEARLLRQSDERDAIAPDSARRSVAEGTAPIVDPYAAIQAEAEWSRAIASTMRPETSRARPVIGAGPRVSSDRVEGTPGSPRSSNVRAENGQEFAPYGRLFAPLNAAGDSE